MIADESLFCTYCLLSLDVIGLQGVSREIPLDRVLQGVGALEELLALLLSNRSLRSIKVFIKELPEVIGHVENLKVTGKPENNYMLRAVALIVSKDKLTGIQTSSSWKRFRSIPPPSGLHRSASSGIPGRCSRTSHKPLGAWRSTG